MELKEIIKVMQHYDKGGDVYFKRKYENDTKWSKLLSNPSWNWDTYEYCIKEQKPKVTIEKWLFRDKQGDFLVIEISNADNYKQYEKIKLIKSYEVEL